MAEAEDVLIDAAERVVGATRGIWRRQSDGDEAPDTGAARRRLEHWLQAAFGRSWSVYEADAPPMPRWLGVVFGRLATWQRAPHAIASTDGQGILIPRVWLTAAADAAIWDQALVAALSLGSRLIRSSAQPCGASIDGRDLAWCEEAARIDALLGRAWPGLAPRIAALRSRALRARPSLAALHPAERVVELRVRALLGASATAQNAADGSAASGASHRSSVYRGMAPVAHWGVPRALTTPTTPAQAMHGLAVPPGRTRRLGRRVERRIVDPDERGRPGPFVVPFGDAHLTVQDAAGLERPPDSGDEDLDALAEEVAAQAELPVVRSSESAREVLESDAVRVDAVARRTAGDDTAAWRYPEWDHTRHAYRTSAVTLYETTAPAGDPAWSAQVRSRHAGLLRLLRRRFEALRPRVRPVRRQLEGDDFDPDGWVAEWGDRCAGRAPAGRIYTAVRRRRREVSVGLLVDASGSTDAWVSGGARVIDVAREAALCFCEALAALGDRHAVWAFSGRGPHGVRVWTAKSFADRFDAAVEARIAGIAPDASTRLGAALRHATAALAREPSHERLLLLLSDGKPHDDDGYEGRYGVEDVRQAVAEARAAGVRVFCTTIDRAGPDYLPRMFGAFGYTVVRDVRQLPARLADLHRQLTT